MVTEAWVLALIVPLVCDLEHLILPCELFLTLHSGNDHLCPALLEGGSKDEISPAYKRA